MKSILNFFDKLEDKVRIKLSHYPIIYAIIVGTAVVLFWRGIWHAADITPILQNSFVSILLSFLLLLITGTLISSFIGNEIIISGIKNEKKAIESAVVSEKEIIKEESLEIVKLKNLELELMEIKLLLKKLSSPKKTLTKKKVSKITK